MKRTFGHRSAVNGMFFTALLALCAAGSAAAEDVTVVVSLHGGGAAAAVVSFYVLDDDTGEAVFEVTLDAISKSGHKRKAVLNLLPEWNDGKHRAAVRVDARKAMDAVWVSGFKTSQGVKQKGEKQNVEGQTVWLIAGDEAGEGDDDDEQGGGD